MLSYVVLCRVVKSCCQLISVNHSISTEPIFKHMEICQTSIMSDLVNLFYQDASNAIYLQ